MADKPEKTCFVIAPISDENSDTRKRSNHVLKHLIIPAVKPLGYVAKRADELPEPGMITSQVIQRIVESQLVIADLTERNPNVFYELALRHAIKRPFIQLIRKGEKIPFDVAGARTIEFDLTDLDSNEAVKVEIGKQIQWLENNGAELQTPISVSLDLQSLKSSHKPEERSMADILGMLTDMRTWMQNYENRDARALAGEVENLRRALDKANMEREALMRENQKLEYKRVYAEGRTKQLEKLLKEVEAMKKGELPPELQADTRKVKGVPKNDPMLDSGLRVVDMPSSGPGK